MNIQQYVTSEEVTRVCNEIGIDNWSNVSKIEISIKDAKAIMDIIDSGNTNIDAKDFRDGLEVELEHGTMFPQYNVTNNHPILTGMIVMAHFMESLDYYKRLEIAELEGDMYKAFKSGDSKKLAMKYESLLHAKQALSASETS